MKSSCRTNMQVAHRSCGAALPSAVILLVSLTLIAVTVAYRATLDEQMGANQRDALNAMSLADSGIEAGFAEVKANYSDLPQAICDIANAGTNLVSDNAISGGSYAVTVNDCLAGDSAVLRSVGQVNGAERQVELLLTFEPGGGGQDHTILTHDDIQISNSPRFVGPIVSIHSNSGITKVSGAPITCTTAASCGTEADPPTGYLSTSGTFDPKTWELVGGAYPWELTEGAAEVEIPHVYPPDWRPFATVEFTADCRVVAGAAHPSLTFGTQIWSVSSQGTWHGWSCSTIWEMKSSSATLYSGFYYIHGNIKISASPSTTWQASFVTAGSIAITCCAQFKPYGQTGNEIADNIFLLAGNDIQITGSPGNVNEGIIAAHMEIKLAGSGAHFKGSVLAENGKYWMGQEVTTNVQRILNHADYNTITSDVILEGTGIGLGSGSPELVVAGWRELVH